MQCIGSLQLCTKFVHSHCCFYLFTFWTISFRVHLLLLSARSSASACAHNDTSDALYVSRTTMPAIMKSIGATFCNSNFRFRDFNHLFMIRNALILKFLISFCRSNRAHFPTWYTIMLPLEGNRGQLYYGYDDRRFKK